jgi:hypothetical protein
VDCEPKMWFKQSNPCTPREWIRKPKPTKWMVATPRIWKK